MLIPEKHTPHVCSGEVIGIDGGKAWVMHHAGEPVADLWAMDADRANMARVHMGRPELLALAALLVEAAGALNG